MKAIKFFSVALAMTFAMNVNAQFTSGGSKKLGGNKTYASFEPEKHFVFDFRVGSAGGSGSFGLGIGYQKSFYGGNWGTLAWDGIFEWSAPFKSPADCDYLSLKAGLRYFTPSFAKDNLRLYTNLAMGYTCVLAKGAALGGGNAGMDEIKEAYMKASKTDSNSDWDAYENLCDIYGYDLDAQEKYIKQVYGGDDILEDLWEAGMINEAWEIESAALAATKKGGGIVGGSTTMKANHGFGLTWGIGLQYKKKFSIGYSLQYETAFKTKIHFATIGISF